MGEAWQRCGQTWHAAVTQKTHQAEFDASGDIAVTAGEASRSYQASRPRHFDRCIIGPADVGPNVRRGVTVLVRRLMVRMTALLAGRLVDAPAVYGGGYSLVEHDDVTLHVDQWE